MKRAKLFMLLAVLITSLPYQAPAQYRDSLGTPWSNPISATMSTMIWNKINEATMYGTQNRRSGNSSTSRARPAQKEPEVVPAYRLYPVVRFKSTGTRLKLQELVEAFGGTPQEKAETKELLTKILDKFDASAAAKGYPNDLALAFVSYIALNAHVYNQETEEMIVSLGQNIGLRDVLAESVRDNGSFDGLTDRQKQETYEAMVMMAGITMHFYEEARKKNNVEDLKSCKVVAERNLKYLGITP